ncbi:hypothetical protein [Pseudoalteromonas ruthenica]|uniref:hypothetical protein n=1 Tax=Pseudoalteromonas ruthenica TaxID=151081 RepID=UPI00110AF0E2|nr:hypothetical protein [Pseudoalteromonas ruthenica]TMP23754.1 hypothetical protein CWC06_09375 [Pseudoalteromonas ruthenica]
MPTGPNEQRCLEHVLTRECARSLSIQNNARQLLETAQSIDGLPGEVQDLLINTAAAVMYDAEDQRAVLSEALEASSHATQTNKESQ